MIQLSYPNKWPRQVKFWRGNLDVSVSIANFLTLDDKRQVPRIEILGFHASRHRILQATGFEGFMQFKTLRFSCCTNSFHIAGSQITFLCHFFSSTIPFIYPHWFGAAPSKTIQFPNPKKSFGLVLSRKYCEMTNPLGHV